MSRPKRGMSSVAVILSLVVDGEAAAKAGGGCSVDIMNVLCS